ncbi:MAG TPA: flagellar basal body L-ring protein FlgH [Ignavibacteriaceae bacterium]|mgnify:CR=1 FL=1|jgi:flagellar L-ring protein precursor FlgH|nr:flagellar basal body L-ring protein FlgH [Ignavibacteriaceae bacterium]
MKKLIVITVFTAVYGFLNAQDLRQNSYNSLFSDYKAGRLGDAITIIVIESSQASNQSETSTGTNSDLGFSGAASIGSTKPQNASATIGSKNSFRGSGSTKTSGLVKTRISASIDSVLENGNLRINGSRKIVINGEEQIVRIKGIVRPSDIHSDNSVLSYNISDAEIFFEGNGMIDRAQKPGWLTKLFHWIF